MSDTATEERTHRVYPERVNMLRWVASCEDCDFHEAVTRGREIEGGKLSLEETAKALAAEHKGQVYVQPGTSSPVSALELQPGDLFTVKRPLEGGNVFRFTRISGNEQGAKWVDCWEIEKDSKRGYVGVRARSFHFEEIRGRAA